MPSNKLKTKKNSEVIRGIKYISLHEKSGYGIAAYRYLRGLIKSGIPLTWSPLIRGRKWENLGYKPLEKKMTPLPEFASFLNKKIEYDTVIIHTIPEYFPVIAKEELGKTIIGCTVWETTKPPDSWISLLNIPDGIIVPCMWNKEVFERSGISVPIHVVPYIFDSLSFNEKTPVILNSEKYTFYTIGTWTVRKTIWNTIKCYLDTFTANDPVILKIKTTKKNFTNVKFKRFFWSTKKTLNKIIKNYPNPAEISLILADLKDEEMLKLHQSGDCYISLVRSEGWGLGAFDAAGSGKPVIITGFGNHNLKDDNGN